MYAALNDNLRSWRLDTRQEANGDWSHYIFASGVECWRPVGRIGGGTFGEVWQEQCLSGPHLNELRAVKHISKRQAQFITSSERELEALVTFSHDRYQEHFVRCLGWFENEDDLCIAMEFVQNGDLQGFINNRNFPEVEAALITAQVAQALQYMHRQNFVHRDLKPQNILVSQPGPGWRVKITDFGIARVMDGTNFGTRNIGTHGYMAPELMDQNKRCTPAVDVWALGAVTFCMRTGRPPNAWQLIEYQRDQDQFPGRPLGTCSGSLMAFVMATMAQLPERRLSIDQVLGHEWLAMRTSGTTGADVGLGTASTSTPAFDIEPANTWSNTYNGTSSSTVQAAQPTAIPPNFPVPGSAAQKTSASRPMNPLQSSQPRPQVPPSAPSPAQTQTLEIPPPTRPINPRTPTPRGSMQPGLLEANTALSRASRRTGSEPFASRGVTATSPYLAPVPPPDVRRTSAPSMTATAYPSEVWNPYEQPTTSPPPSNVMKLRTVPATTPRTVPTTSPRTIPTIPPRTVPTTTPKTAPPTTPRMVPATVPRSVPTATKKHETTGQMLSNPYLTCETCGKTFKEREYLMGHVRTVNHKPCINDKPRETAAPPCPTQGAANTPEVMPAAHPANDPYLICGTCNKTFKNRSHLMDHVATSRHRPREPIDPRLTCLACHKNFKSRTDLFDHLEATGHARDVATGKPERPAVLETAAPGRSGNPNEGLESYTMSGPRHAPREGFKPGGEDINPEHTCLTCHKTFRYRPGLFNHLAMSGHALGLGTGKPKRPVALETADPVWFGNPNEGLENYTMSAPRHAPREGFIPRGGHINPDLTCLACHKTFRDRPSLFNHLALSGHALDLAKGRPEGYRGPKALQTTDYMDLESTDSDMEEDI